MQTQPNVFPRTRDATRARCCRARAAHHRADWMPNAAVRPQPSRLGFPARPAGL